MNVLSRSSRAFATSATSVVVSGAAHSVAGGHLPHLALVAGVTALLWALTFAVCHKRAGTLRYVSLLTAYAGLTHIVWHTAEMWSAPITPAAHGSHDVIVGGAGGYGMALAHCIGVVVSAVLLAAADYAIAHVRHVSSALTAATLPCFVSPGRLVAAGAPHCAARPFFFLTDPLRGPPSLRWC